MIKQTRYKIALIGDMLSKGGAEKVQARLSLFFEAQGIAVHHIIVQDRVTYEYAGELFNLGKIKKESNGIFDRWNRFWELKRYLNNNRFDYIIDFRFKSRFIQEFAIAKWLYKAPYVMNISSFNTEYYFPKNNIYARKIYKKAYGFVTVSKALEQKVKNLYGYSNVQVIYNPIDFFQIEKDSKAIQPLNFRYILGIGRMAEVKQFDHLIITFANSEAREKGIKLVLMGEGEQKETLEALAKLKNCTNDIVFLKFQENPYPYYKQAEFVALTSKNEGFPNVLIESLACETPVVAYDCESGPNEIIRHQVNGLLVQNQNPSEMTKAINRMISDKNLYENCKSHAKSSVEKFNFESIGKQWLDFLKIPNKL
jgi:N-acetylgalactosamine-N,N'-diacetylbacillosaminyl-diphospho-undecaprenol 4-alpha-N-acetylgalactosaminyltransferase